MRSWMTVLLLATGIYAVPANKRLIQRDQTFDCHATPFADSCLQRGSGATFCINDQTILLCLGGGMCENGPCLLGAKCIATDDGTGYCE